MSNMVYSDSRFCKEKNLKQEELLVFKNKIHKRFKRTVLFGTKHNLQILWSNPLYQATKHHLNNT